MISAASRLHIIEEHQSVAVPRGCRNGIPLRRVDALSLCYLKTGLLRASITSLKERIILLRALGPGEERENGIGNSLRSRVLFSRAQQHNKPTMSTCKKREGKVLRV